VQGLSHQTRRAFKRYGSTGFDSCTQPCFELGVEGVAVAGVLRDVRREQEVQAVAVQVDPFESKGLKPVYHFSGSRVETRRFQAMGQLDSTVPGTSSYGFNLYQALQTMDSTVQTL
jgi:hypothetical protein